MLEAFKASVDRDTAQEQRQLRAAAKAAGRSGGGEAVRQPSGGPMVADPGAPDISDNPQAPGTAGAPAGSVSQQGTQPLTREPSTTPVRPAQSQAYADLAPVRYTTNGVQGSSLSCAGATTCAPFASSRSPAGASAAAACIVTTV